MRKPLPPPWDQFVPFAQKVFVWAMVFGVLWFLRSFFFLVFLVFVFGYVMQHGVTKLERRIKSRRLRVVIVFLLLLTGLVGVGWALGPEMARQAQEFPRLLRRNQELLDQEITRLRAEKPSLAEYLPEKLELMPILGEVFGLEGLGFRQPAAEEPDQEQLTKEEETGRMIALADELALATERLVSLSDAMTAEQEGDPNAVPVEEGGPARDELKAATDRLVEATHGLTVVAERRAADQQDSLAGEPDERWKPILPKVIYFAGRSLSIGSAFLLSLLFSFLIVLDFPNLARGARHLHDTRLQFVYDEISDSVFHFGEVLGQALEAQLMIAILNTGLTAIGLAIMGMPSIAFLSTVVFVCSFIPVAGVFISSVPICLTALTVGGIGLLLWSILFITIIHMIEAYILNPRIYGAHLRMNPVVVLAILVMSHHLFGVWGLILGVPLVNYAVNFVIHGKPDRRAAEELE
ncbi:MAG: AI-2E family transporter [Planctomycetota bacterium]